LTCQSLATRLDVKVCGVCCVSVVAAELVAGLEHLARQADDLLGVVVVLCEDQRSSAPPNGPERSR
jgi:hypothetical protein